MLKKVIFLELLFCVMLAIGIPNYSATDVGAALPSVKSFSVYPNCVCVDAALMRLGNVTKMETMFEFTLFDFYVSYENDNPARNAPPASGDAHIGDSVVESVQITAAQVSKNGTAELTGVCIEFEDIVNTIMSAILPNSSWTNISYQLHGFKARLALYELAEAVHIIELDCTYSDDNDDRLINEGDSLNCSEYYNWQPSK